MNKFLEFLKSLFDLTDEQVEKAELELKNVEKSESDIDKTQLNQWKNKKEDNASEEVEKSTEKEEKVKTESVDDKNQSADAMSIKDGENTVTKADYEKLEKELSAMKAILEQTQSERAAEKRSAKIKSVKDCVDYDVLTSLLTGVEDKDIDSKVEEIKKSKGYLFKTIDTQGFNPASPQNQLSGIEAAFFELNPDLKV